MDWDSLFVDEEETFVLQTGVGPYIYKPNRHISDQLIGAKINGASYGDTTLVYIEKDERTNPDHFTLYQNYPNPFNPSTTFYPCKID